MMATRKQTISSLKRCCHSKPTSQRPYSSKVRAFPFVIPKEQAIQDLSFWTCVATGGPGDQAAKYFGTIIRQFLPSLNIETVRPTRFQPAYLPVWVVDAQFRADVWLMQQPRDSNPVKDTVYTHFLQTDIPGFAFPPLSTVNLKMPSLSNSEIVPWSDRLRKHEDDDVLCLPFSLSPFKLAEAARSLPLGSASLSKMIRFDPSTVEDTFMAAYPILIPIYIAQFTVTNLDSKDSSECIPVTAFMEAGHKQPQKFIQAVPLAQRVFQYFLNRRAPELIMVWPSREAMTFTHINSMLSPHSTTAHRELLQRVIDLRLRDGKTMKTYEERYFGKIEPEAVHAVNWADVRIRPFTPEERSHSKRWLRTEENLLMLKTIRKSYETRASEDSKRQVDPADNEKSEAGVSGRSPLFTEKDGKWVNDSIAMLEKTQKEIKPEWLAEYELQQRLVAKHPGTPSTDDSPPPKEQQSL